MINPVPGLPEFGLQPLKPHRPHRPQRPQRPHRPQFSPDQLDAVVIEAKKKNRHRKPKQLSVNFPEDNTNCLGYSMLGCV